MDEHAQSHSPPGRPRRLPEVSTVATLDCGGGSCPTVYRTAEGAYLVQGRPVDPASAGIDVPAHEVLVELPEELLELLRQGGRQAE